MKTAIAVIVLMSMQLVCPGCGERVLWRLELHAGAGSADPPAPLNVETHVDGKLPAP